MRFYTLILLSFAIVGTTILCQRPSSKPLNVTTDKSTDDESWNPDAGYIAPYAATLIASSRQSDAYKIIDGDPQSFWQSDAPFPTHYIKDATQNILLHRNAKVRTDANLAKAIDGDLDTSTPSILSKGKYRLSIYFLKKSKIVYLGLKMGNSSKVSIRASDTQKELQYASSDSYQFKNFKLETTTQQLEFVSDRPFELFEVAATQGAPQEYVILDFGKTVPVGTIVTRHWSGEDNALHTSLELSKDGQHWQSVASLRSSLEHPFITNLPVEIEARYLKVTQHLKGKDWDKVFLWEVAAYDKYGQYGQPPQPQPSRVTVRELLGVNSTWGWGHNEYSDLLAAADGPNCYAPLVSHARNYHDLKWDVHTPTHIPNYVNMAAGKGSEVHWWLNWDREYAAWCKANLKTQTTLQIHHFDDADWIDPYKNAYDIGRAFAKHFGTTTGNGMVEILEVGNEPWQYNAATYRKILTGMAAGVKASDPQMQVLPCALQAADPAMEQSKIFMNYMGVRLPQAAAKHIDGLNIHCYSYLQDEENQRIAVQPEHPNSSFREIFSNIRFRDHNLPELPVYLSEWGWDHTGGGEACTHSECVSEKAAAAYGVRGALMAMRSGIARATWFFFANEARPSSLYTRSGLTGSVHTKFRPKRVYHALHNLIKLVGDRYFLDVIQEKDNGWIYLLGDADGDATHLIAWLPRNGDDTRTETFVLASDLSSAIQQRHGIRLDGLTAQGKRVSLEKQRDGRLVIPWYDK
ncbi:MAG: discoidin domain-containing protein, partial [Bacteroidota bacterium]